MPAPEIVVCSHRGPSVFERTNDGIVARRGSGGLIGAVAPIMGLHGGTWIAAALTDGDRAYIEQAPRGHDEGGFVLRLLDLPADLHEQHYGVVSNEHLWFLFHYLFDPATHPAFGERFARAWEAYRRVNELYADAVRQAGRGAAVLVEDYHLMLVGGVLRSTGRVRRPLVYFHHTPWCEPDYFSMLPGPVAEEILRSMLAYDVVGFHAQRWADAFGRCCQRYLPGAKVSRGRVTWRRRSTRVLAAPVPLDTARLSDELGDERTTEWAQRHDEMRAGRKLLLRVDRIDLSKNPLRGFLAFEALLERRPRLAKDIVFLALLYPSRLALESYRRYYADCTGVVRRINERFEATTDAPEGPVVLHFEDDYHRSLGAMTIYDTLLVNPVFDGLNLVAKEGAFANASDGALILSRNAGVFEELGTATEPVNPFDVTETADAIERTASMSATDRRRRAKQLKTLVTRTTPEGWLRTQLRAAGV